MYRQAILDAKAVRASAIANAKASLQEAFEPRIQEMLRLKLSEELEEEIEEGFEEEGVAVANEGEIEEDGKVVTNEEDMEESELDEILAELDSLSEETEEEGKVQEGYEEMEEGEEEEEEEEDGMEDEEGEEGMEDAEGEEVTDDTKVVELTLGDLKQVMADLIAQGEVGEEIPSGDDEMGDDEMGDEDGAHDVSLDEILAELEEEGNIEEAKGKQKKDGYKDRGHGYGKQNTYTQSAPEVKPGQMGKTSPKAAKIGQGYGGSSISEPFTKSTSGGKDHTPYSAKVQDKKSGALAEANKTIEELTVQLNEINLLNAKLLYMNKIFKSKSLNESQKVKVVTAFDRASSVKEVKNIYEILKESVGNKTAIKESLGFASKPAGVAPKKDIVDADPTANRWKQLVFGNK